MQSRRQFLRSAVQASVSAFALTLVGPGMFLRDARGEPVSLDSLRGALSSGDAQLLLPTDREFLRQRQGYNLRVSLTPMAILRVQTVRGIQVAIEWAQKNGVSVRIRSGGHCFEDFSSGTGLLIDVSPLNSIQIDSSKKTVVIGSGARLGEVVKALASKGLTLTTGSCPTVGVAGLVLGGGYGMLSRKYGMTCDNLLSLKMVLADGRLVNASATENPELFWACRGGGGGNFGVATEFTFRTFAVKDVLVFALRFSSETFETMVNAWQEFAPRAADELTCHLNVAGLGDGSLNPVKVGGLFVARNEGSAPRESDLKSLLSPLTRAASPILFKISAKSYYDSTVYFAGGEDSPTFFKNKSDFATERLTSRGISTLKSGLKKVEGGPVAAIFSSYGGAIARVPADATAFVHRADTLFGVQYICHWSRAEKGPQRLRTIRELHQSMRPHFSGRAYINYPDSDLVDSGPAYYASNFLRLQSVKAKYDPQGFFSIGPQGIKPRS